MKKQTARRVIASVIGGIAFTAIILTILKDLQLSESIAIAVAASILNLMLFLWENPKRKQETISIRVKAWDNREIKVRALEEREQIEIHLLELANSWDAADVLKVYWGMVEPKMNNEEIVNMAQDNLDAVIEISDAVDIAGAERYRGRMRDKGIGL